MQFSMKRFLLGMALTFFLTFPPRLAAQQPEVIPSAPKNPAFAERIQIHGVKHAGKLNDHLYRGTQPNQDGLIKGIAKARHHENR